MEKSKKLPMMMIAFAIIALLGTTLVAARFGGGAFGLTDEERADRQEFHESVREAIQNGDYITWKSLMESQINEERFSEIVERYQQREEKREKLQELKTAIQAGDTETAQSIREELGITEDFKKGFRFGQRHGLR